VLRQGRSFLSTKFKPKWTAISHGRPRHCRTTWARWLSGKARHKAEAALGSRFNIRAFHDTVLAMGSVPLQVLEDRIDLFIAQGGKGPYPDME
jgi:Bacterial protein of unknown function (DUF885)